MGGHTIMEINGDNIRFSIVDKKTIANENDAESKLPCYMEIRITREFFKNFFKLKRLRFTSNTSGFFNITEREMQVLNRMVNGMNNNQIAKDLHVSVCTAKAHVSNIYTKLSVKSRIKAVVKAIKNKIVNI